MVYWICNIFYFGSKWRDLLKNSTELCNIVYNVLLSKIQFGVYGFGEKLPTMEEASACLHVSVDTTRAAYLRLKEEGYITLSKKAGAAVKVNYDAREREAYIQAFFSPRRQAMMDLGRSLQPLFGNAQWTGLKNASSETLQAIERLYRQGNDHAPYAMLDNLELKYSALGNRLLMRLVWQTFMFLHDPFFSVRESKQYFEQSADHLPTVLNHCRKKDWAGLRCTLDEPMKRLSSALEGFYASKITMPSLEKESAFVWSVYKKSQQLCYSFAMELLLSISMGTYPEGSLLPSQKELAEQRGVSVSTARRALGLLGCVGAVKSAKYVGTRVLPLEKATENSDFTNPVFRRRLVDMTESFQILALSCRETCELTLSSLDAHAIELIRRKLKIQKERKRGETLSFQMMDIIVKYAPFQTIRSVYSELQQQFFWANAFHGMIGSQDTVNAVYGPYMDVFIEALEKTDFLRFSEELEALMIYEFRKTAGFMSKLGIPGTETIWIPKPCV